MRAVITAWLTPMLIAGATIPAFCQQAPNFDQRKIEELLLRRSPKSAQTKIDATIRGKTGETAGEIFKSYRESINRCWNFAIAGNAAPNVTLEVRYTIDGKLEGDPKLINPITKANYLRAAAAAVDAVTNCQPASLPREDYHLWKVFQITFDPKVR